MSLNETLRYETLPKSFYNVVVKDFFSLRSLLAKGLRKNPDEFFIVWCGAVPDAPMSTRVFSLTAYPGVFLLPEKISCAMIADGLLNLNEEARYAEGEVSPEERGWEISASLNPPLVIAKARKWEDHQES